MFRYSRGSSAEKGGVAVIVAVLLAGGVLFGASAIAIDVGNMMFERRQLQNGTDATAMKLADICGSDVTTCNDASAKAKLVALASLNAVDGMSQLDTSVYANGQCGRVPGAPSMPACASLTSDASISNLGQCPALPAWLKAGTFPYVETYTLTDDKGASKLKSFFGMAGTRVTACARVAWGPAKKTSVLPLTFGECEWASATNVLSSTNTIDPTKTPVYNKEIALAVNYDTKKAACASYNGHDYMGGFGWLEHPSGICEVNADENSWVPGWPGNGTGNDCLPDVHVGDTVLIPIYDCINDNKAICPNDVSSKTYYHIKGMASFLVTAIDLTGKTEGTPGGAAKSECQNESNNKQCIYGKFLKDLTPVGQIDTTGGGGTDYGLTVAQPVG
jgi:hypothetical protein